MKNYQFPVKNKFEARAVTELDFEIQPDDFVYVNMDTVRGKEYWDEILYNLNVDQGRLFDVTESFTKIIFSGHRGSGKSMELKRFQKMIHHPNRYFSVFIEIEHEMEVAGFQSEDLFIILIARLIEEIKQNNLEFESEYLDEIMKEWLSHESVQTDLKDNFKVDLSSEMGAGFTFFSFLKLKGAFKAVFSSESQTSRTIRQEIRKNPMRLIDRFNLVLVDLRKVLKEKNLGKDILFILDGTEKIPYEIYKKLFCEDSFLIRSINANMIFSVPINSYFDIEGDPSSDFFQTFTLPMIRVTNENIPLLGQVITKRIDRDSFVENDSLEFCVKKSGGCIRQLLRIINRALIIGQGRKITLEIAGKSVYELGRKMKEKLDSDHMEILKEKKYNTADGKTLDLLFSLAVLKYNGDRAVNPMLEEFIDGSE